MDPAALLEEYRSGGCDLIVVLGPTASGKTRYAVALAREINRLSGAPVAEIISADSRQVFRGMDIGTGKDLSEYGEISHHLLDICEAGGRYSAYRYQADFCEAYQDILQRRGVPILCGGTGLYIEAAACGYDFTRKDLSHTTGRPESREAGLPSITPVEGTARESQAAPSDVFARDLAAADDPEIDLASGSASAPADVSGFPSADASRLPRKPFFIGTLVTREERIARIDARLLERLEEGMVDEVRSLLESGVPPEAMYDYGLEYRYVTMYLQGELSYDEMVSRLATAIHRFAKRQMTWWRGMERDGHVIHWVRV